MPKDHPSPSRKDTYRWRTHRPINNLAIVFPLLLLFHLGASYESSVLLTPRYVGQVLRFFGASAAFLPPACIVVVLLLQQALHHEPWQIQPKVLAGMVGESILWTIPLIALSYMAGKLSVPAQPAWLSQGGQELFGEILLAVGAGVYEEFIFRLVFISLTMLLLVDVMGLRKDIVLIAVIVASAVLFSLCHFSGDQLTGKAPFPTAAFVFLSTAGVLWGSMFAFRGFAIACGSHILWDLFVVFALHGGRHTGS